MRQISIAVVGAAHPNSDGGNRRSEITFCDPGEELLLVPEPKNPHDEHAIAVFSARKFQIGYVASQRAVYLKKLMRDGHEVRAIFQDVATWGAIARVGIDCVPELPIEGAREGADDYEDALHLNRSRDEYDPYADYDPADHVDPIWPDD